MEQYLDNSATTKVCRAACEAVTEAMRVSYGNPSSLHKMGLEAERRVTASRKIIAQTLSCEPGELIFTSGATESNNMAIYGITSAYSRNGKKIVTTMIEHPSVLEPCARLEQEGYTVIKLPPDKEGHITPEAFVEAVDQNTVLVAFMLVNNEIGTILEAEQICRAVKRKNPKTLIHIDAVQGYCKIPFSLRKVSADTVSISGHKIYAPKGIGGLFVRKGVRLKPLVTGGGQEKGLRSGTESVPLIAGFGAAVSDTFPQLKTNFNHYIQLNEAVRQQLAAISEITINSKQDAAPYILNFSVQGIRSEIMLHHLERMGIYVSSGSACAKGAQSHVLAAFGLTKALSDTALRISFSPETDQEALDGLINGLKSGLEVLAKSRYR